jgi:hypothetical protein
MFKKQNFPVEFEDRDELNVFRNIWRLGLHRVTAQATVFHYADAILWILNHIDLENQHAINAK